jgi:hypothetical protein
MMSRGADELSLGREERGRDSREGDRPRKTRESIFNFSVVTSRGTIVGISSCANGGLERIESMQRNPFRHVSHVAHQWRLLHLRVVGCQGDRNAHTSGHATRAKYHSRGARRSAITEGCARDSKRNADVLCENAGGAVCQRQNCCAQASRCCRMQCKERSRGACKPIVFTSLFLLFYIRLYIRESKLSHSEKPIVPSHKIAAVAEARDIVSQGSSNPLTAQRQRRIQFYFSPYDPPTDPAPLATSSGVIFRDIPQNAWHVVDMCEHTERR